MSLLFDDGTAQQAAEFIQHSLSASGLAAPAVGVILGSGLGSAAQRLANTGGTVIPYSAIPGMPTPHVAGHAGQLVIGRLGPVPVVMLQGRVHYYEGHSTNAIVFGTAMLAKTGIHTLVVTNAAGGIHSAFRPGDLMLIRSHLPPLAARELDLRFGQKTSVGQTSASQTDRPALSGLWCSRLRKIARDTPTPLTVHEGVYAMMTGPTYETPTEIRMLRGLGADAVGMSTVPESVYAASRNIEVLGISCITNVAAGLSDVSLNHAEVTATASSVESEFVDWLWKLLPQFAEARSIAAVPGTQSS